MLATNPLEIELTTKCTLGCPACPRNNPHRNKKDWDVGHLNTDMVKQFADSPIDRRYLFIGCWGDPIYHPDFIDIVRHYVDRNKRLAIHTNGSFKKQKWWNELASLNWTKRQQFTFSVDGLEDTNHIYRIRADWQSIELGMRIMGRLPQNRRPYLEWKMMVFPYNKHQVPQAKQLADEIGFDNYEPVVSVRPIDHYHTDNKKLFDWNNNEI
jgi:MoaA/NifB/PqqE/SkfB family radical SAM enzyme